jgi:protease I
MAKLDGQRIAILATDGFEQSELMLPLQRLKAEGATVEVISPKPGQIRGWKEKEWGDSVKVDRLLDDASIEDYDALVLPGGPLNPDVLRLNKRAVDFVRRFYESGKPLAAICHAPWLLIEAGLVDGKRIAAWPSLQTDLRNAGAEWVDEPVVVEDGLITSRKPDDLDAFVGKIIEEMREGVHEDREAEVTH